MSAEISFTVKEDVEDGCVAEALGHDIVTQGETMDEIRKMVREAVRCHFEPQERPAVIRLHIVKQEVMPV